MVEMDKFEAEFSRFFNFPQQLPFKSPSYLHLNAKSKVRASCKGAWVVASSTSVIQLLRSSDDSSPIISVSINGEIVEEHFVSRLYYSWPQVSCVPECPIRGSRAVFLSYKDGSGQIQKFAVRFSKSCIAEKFICAIKECLNYPPDITPQALTYNDKRANTDQQRDSVPSPLVANYDNVVSKIPPSFSEMLASCVTDSRNVEQTVDNIKCKSITEAAKPKSAAPGASVQLPDNDIKSQIMKYMADASFHDLLYKVEKFINESGADICL